MAAFINPLSWFDKFPQNEKEILMLSIKRKTFPKTMRIRSSIFSIWVYIFVECRNSCRDWLINVIQVEFQLWLDLFLNSQIFFGCTFAINSQMTSSLLPEIMFMLTDIDNVNAKNHSAQKKHFSESIGHYLFSHFENVTYKYTYGKTFSYWTQNNWNVISSPVYMLNGAQWESWKSMKSPSEHSSMESWRNSGTCYWCYFCRVKYHIHFSKSSKCCVVFVSVLIALLIVEFACINCNHLYFDRRFV